ncbi:MAG TPA: transcriptional regulator YeiL [Lachnospiraceae bacterium]|nr:transcriptional regulator YeiL [Lachnospiraceae bacterium]
MIQSKNIQYWVTESDILNIFSFDIQPYLELHTFEKNATICSEGEQFQMLYFLVEGRAKLYITHTNGKVSMINFLTAPNLIGEMELIGAQEFSHGITALTECKLLALPLYKLREQLLSDSKFLLFLCKFLSSKALKNTKKFSQNINYTLKERLAYFILLSTDINDGKVHRTFDETGTSFNIYKERHTEVAEYLGVSYRHLLYVFTEFCEKQILKKTSKGYLITDYSALHTLSADIQKEQELLDFW